MRNLKRTLISTALITVMGASHADDWQGEAKDAWIDGKVETSLMMNKNLDSFEINTDVKNGEVTLSGMVSTDAEKQMAEDVARSVDGVEDVVNRLIVGETEDDRQSSAGHVSRMMLAEAAYPETVEQSHAIDDDQAAQQPKRMETGSAPIKGSKGYPATEEQRKLVDQGSGDVKNPESKPSDVDAGGMPKHADERDGHNVKNIEEHPMDTEDMSQFKNVPKSTEPDRIEEHPMDTEDMEQFQKVPHSTHPDDIKEHPISEEEYEKK